MENDYTKSFKIMPYILILCLLAFLFYQYYLFIFKSQTYYKNIIPKNSINVSPISGEVVQNVTSNPPLLQVNYECNNISRLYDINSADIVIEEFSPSSNSLNYKGIFYSKNIAMNESISSIKSISMKTLPAINFIDKIDLNEYKFSNNIDTVFISYAPNLNASLIYKNNEYYHYSTKVPDINSFSNEPITFKNIIIDPDYLSKQSHNGMLFSGGKFQKLQINGLNIKMINNSKSIPLSLLRGNTIWIRCIPSVKIITAYSNLEG